VMWGKIGNLVIQRTKRGTMYIRRHVIPANPRTIAQQTNRMAFKAGIDRWRTHEKLIHKEYWDKIAEKHRFRDGYRAFLSSFMTRYQAKVQELSGESAALAWMSDSANIVDFVESPARQTQEILSDDLIAVVLRKRQSKEFLSLIERSINYINSREWPAGIRYGLLPFVDSSNEWDIMRLGLLNNTPA